MGVKKVLPAVVRNMDPINYYAVRTIYMKLGDGKVLAAGVNFGTTLVYGLNFLGYVLLGEVATLGKFHMWNLLRQREDFALSFREIEWQP